ncbi:hypothetical protein EAF00_002011 [Botryotinia globosa]|nr:hypothetical protein EAF00_002011 [Botryotinia globosa]
MHYSTLSTMLSFIAFSHATAIPSINCSSADIVARNADHVSLYTTSACAQVSPIEVKKDNFSAPVSPKMST